MLNVTALEVNLTMDAASSLGYVLFKVFKDIKRNVSVLKNQARNIHLPVRVVDLRPKLL